MPRSPAKELAMPPKLKLDKNFQPCPLDDGDEAYPNSIFEFNITRLLAHIDARPEDRTPCNNSTTGDCSPRSTHQPAITCPDPAIETFCASNPVGNDTT